MIDLILNHLPGIVLLYLARFFIALSFLLNVLHEPDLSQKSFAYSQKITKIYAVKIVELPIELLKEAQKIINNSPK